MLKETNQVSMAGILKKSFTMSKELNNENLYESILLIEKDLDKIDEVPIVVNKEEAEKYREGDFIEIQGRISTFNYDENDKRRKKIYVTVTNIIKSKNNIFFNKVKLKCHVIKVERNKYLNSFKHDLDLIVTTNSNNIIDYIPLVVVTEKNKIKERDNLYINGYFSSRTYFKNFEEKTAKEISALSYRKNEDRFNNGVYEKKSNFIILQGTILNDFKEFEYDKNKELYSSTIIIQRFSGITDSIIIVISKSEASFLRKGDNIRVLGEIQEVLIPYSVNNNIKKIFVRGYKIYKYPDKHNFKYKNVSEIVGYITEIRHSGQTQATKTDITNMMVSVAENDRITYIPVMYFGNTDAKVRDLVKVKGYLSERRYIKNDILYTVYEISAHSLKKI